MKTFLSILLLMMAGTAWAGMSYHYAPAKVTLAGTLREKMFYGPPGYGEHPKSDRKEHVYVLVLDTPIAVTADTTNDFNVAQENVRQLQIVPLPDAPGTLPALRNQRVEMYGTLFGAQTGHHHTDVLIQLEAVQPISHK